ncbi:hypothetical protein Tco_0410864 [Tanacetum coccineum]
MVACLEKTEGNSYFHEIVDFLASSSIHHALTVSPPIYTSYIEQFWNTASSQTVNDVKQINATVDSKAVVVTEASIRSSLLFNDADGTACLTNEAIFQNLALMGYEGDFNKLTFQKALFSPQWKFLIHTILHCLSSKSTSWNEFSTNIASAVICLATNQKFNFSKLIFDGMLRNLDNTKKKFLMYPRFLMVFRNNQIELGEPFNDVYFTPAHNLKVFTNMSRKGQKFSGKITPPFPNMLAHATEGEGSVEPTEPQPTPSPTQPSTRDQPPKTSSSHATTQDSRDSLEGINGNEGFCIFGLELKLQLSLIPPQYTLLIKLSSSSNKRQNHLRRLWIGGRDSSGWGRHEEKCSETPSTIPILVVRIEQITDLIGFMYQIETQDLIYKKVKDAKVGDCCFKEEDSEVRSKKMSKTTCLKEIGRLRDRMDDLMFDTGVLEDDELHVEAKVDEKGTMIAGDRLLAERLIKEKRIMTDEEKSKTIYGNDGEKKERHFVHSETEREPDSTWQRELKCTGKQEKKKKVDPYGFEGRVSYTYASRSQQRAIQGMIRSSDHQYDDSSEEELEGNKNAVIGEELGVEYFDKFPTRSELAYHKYQMGALIPSLFLRNPIIIGASPANLKIPCNIGHVHVGKAYSYATQLDHEETT